MKDNKPQYQLKLLDRLIQKSVAEEMDRIDEEAIAAAIKTLLHQDDEKVQNIH